MREIKFRCWNEEERLMHPVKILHFDNEGIEKAQIMYNGPIMQFTGLTDKQGCEIYEGDVVVKPYVDPLGGMHVDTKDGSFRVGFEHGQYVLYRTEPQPLVDWCQKEKGEYVSNYGNLSIVKDETVLEVIGNIYENPDLCATKS